MALVFSQSFDNQVQAQVNPSEPTPIRLEWVYTLDLIDAYRQLKNLDRSYVKPLEWLDNDENVTIEQICNGSNQNRSEADANAKSSDDKPKPKKMKKDEPKGQLDEAEDKDSRGCDLLLAVSVGMNKFCKDPAIQPETKLNVVKNHLAILTMIPEVLEANWLILEEAGVKLLEYMKDHKLQDMACVSFKKLSKTCAASFGMEPSFIESVISIIDKLIADFLPNQILMFFEALAYILEKVSDGPRRDRMIESMMEIWNYTWKVIVGRITSTSDNPVHDACFLLMLLRIIISVCEILGGIMSFQICLIYHEMLTIYKIYSSRIAGAYTGLSVEPELLWFMREARKESLKLIQVWIKHLPKRPLGPKLLLELILPEFLKNVFEDFEIKERSDHSEPEVLMTFATIFAEMGTAIRSEFALTQEIFGKSVNLMRLNRRELPMEDHRFAYMSFLKVLCAQPCWNLLLEKVSPGTLDVIVEHIDIEQGRHRPMSTPQTPGSALR